MGHILVVTQELERGAQKGDLLAEAQKIENEPKQHSAGALGWLSETESHGRRGNGRPPQEEHFLGLWRHHPHRARQNYV